METYTTTGVSTVRNMIIFLLFGASLLPIHVFALGLGEIQVTSTLNEKLEARIDLISVVPEDAEVMIVKLASREAFIKSGLDRPHMLTDLRFGTSVKEEHVYITISSAKPVREPSLSFLIEVDWPNGHLIREYTILLEPPVAMRQKAK